MTDGPPEPQPDAAGVSSALDLTQLERTIRNPARRRTMLEQYVASNQADAANLRTAQGSGEPQRIMEAAHRIKGAARVIGAGRLADVSYEVEQAGRDGVLDGIEGKCELVYREIHRVEQAVAAVVGSREEGVAVAGAPGSTELVGRDAMAALVVEPQRMLVDLLVQALKTAGLTASGATSVSEARSRFEQLRPGLVVIDPEIGDGGAFLEMILGGLEPPNVVAIVDSAAGRSQSEAAGIEMIADKSAGLDALVAAIRSAVDLDLRAGAADEEADRLLIVDDDERIRLAVGENLRGRGFFVHQAASGREALDVLGRDGSIRVVLLDVSMPGMGGMEVLREIVKMNPHPGVIMLTGVEDAEIAQQAIRQGAFDYVVKSSDLDVLASSISTCLELEVYEKKPWWKRLF